VLDVGKEKVAKEGDLLIAEESRGEWRVYRKDYLNKDGETAKTMAKSLWTDKEITNDYGRSSVKELFGKAVMDFPKSPALLEKLIKIGSNDGDIVLDFFAGSSSTAHALMNINATEGSNRKFIMVQLPIYAGRFYGAERGYKTISDLSKERIRRAGKNSIWSMPFELESGRRLSGSQGGHIKYAGCLLSARLYRPERPPVGRR
jgi:adenine-specific DNA-methyltransferase